MKKTMLKYLLLTFVLCTVFACTEEEECETETVCFGAGNCVERPTGNCFN